MKPISPDHYTANEYRRIVKEVTIISKSISSKSMKCSSGHSIANRLIVFVSYWVVRIGTLVAILRMDILLVFFTLCIGTARAGIFDNAMSMDTTPIEFDIGGGHYRIPRNYIFQMDRWGGGPQQIVSLRVVYPGFKPFEPDTKDCMLRKMRCRIYELILEDKFPVSEDGFQNEEKLFNKPYPQRGPYGFDLFTVGPENARTEYYRKMVNNHFIIFDCISNNLGERYTVCNHVVKSRSGATVFYFFSFDEMRNAIEIDAEIRNLVDSFSINGRLQ